MRDFVYQANSWILFKHHYRPCQYIEWFSLLNFTSKAGMITDFHRKNQIINEMMKYDIHLLTVRDVVGSEIEDASMHPEFTNCQLDEKIIKIKINLFLKKSSASNFDPTEQKIQQTADRKSNLKPDISRRTSYGSYKPYLVHTRNDNSKR